MYSVHSWDVRAPSLGQEVDHMRGEIHIVKDFHYFDDTLSAFHALNPHWTHGSNVHGSNGVRCV